MQLPHCFGNALSTSTPSRITARSRPVSGHKRRWTSVFALACVLAVLDVPAHAVDARWTIKDLGTLGGSSAAAGVNDAGQVAGSSDLPDGNTTHAYVYKNGVMTDISRAPDWINVARGINNAGQVAGAVATSSSFPRVFFPFLYKNGVMEIIGSAPGEANAINNSGAVAGTTQVNNQSKAFIFKNGVMTVIGTAGEEFGTYSFGAAINDGGQVAGTGINTRGERHAFLYSNGRMIDLGRPGGYSAAYGMNNAGQVVGENWFATSPTFSAHAFLYSAGRMQDLGTLGGTYSRAYDVNNFGAVVGFSFTTGDQEAVPFVYALGKMFNIRDLPGVKESGWVLGSDALAINDAGQIAGTGIKDGQRRAFLLSPPWITGGPNCSDSRKCDAANFPFGQQ